MRILGTGVDLQRVPDVERVVLRHGTRFLGRIFTPAEVAYCQGRARSGQSLAARFAAKEAFRKALGAPPGIHWRDIEVVRTEGAPSLALHETARRQAEARGVAAVHLSLSHSGEYAMAMVILEGEG
jgi:holo-[acyl-carrier protein] synthase